MEHREEGKGPRLIGEVDAVLPVVQDLSLRGVNAFRPSYVSKRTGLEIADVHGALDAMARAGALEPRYELVCLNDACHSTIQTFTSLEEVPLSGVVRCDDCGHEFPAGLAQVWVYYEPTNTFIARTNGQAERGEIPDTRKKAPAGHLEARLTLGRSLTRLRGALRKLWTGSSRPFTSRSRT